MFAKSVPLLCAVIVTAFAPPADARKWTDVSGHYSLTADLVAYSDHSVVLRKANDDLVALPINKLSEADRKFVTRLDGDKDGTKGLNHAWKLKTGLILTGRMVGFCVHDVTIERRLGKVYVNGRRYDKMPGVYRAIIPKIVEHFTEEQVAGEKGLRDWVRGLKNEPRTFQCKGVMMELEEGDLYCVPFFVLADDVINMLKPGWERWVAAKKDYEAKEKESFLAHAQADAYQRQQEQAKQIQQLQLNLQAYDAGLFDLWEVTMYPPSGHYGMPLSVVVPATDSAKAATLAKQKNPAYVVGPMRVVRRRNLN